MEKTAADLRSEQGIVFDVQRYAVHDGPGIRTLVFLSGCPLSCLWCQNPEGKTKRPVLLHYQARCTSCLRCVSVCPEGAVTPADGGHPSTDPSRCALCGLCVVECPADARTLAGKKVTAGEMYDIVERDRAFYRRSGGGVTLSGGDPLVQPSFARALLALCRENYIGTAVETCGYADTEAARLVVEYADTVLFDLKHIDPGEHRRLTGVDNAPILENARLISGTVPSFIVRIPVIPGCNDDDETMAATADFIGTLTHVDRVDLLPYHRFGESKYLALGIEYPLDHIPDPNPERMRTIRSLMEERGLMVMVQGYIDE